MAFTTQWTQLWISTPNNAFPLHLPSTVHWFSYDTPTLPHSPLFPSHQALAFQRWWEHGLGQFNLGPYSAPTQQEYHWWNGDPFHGLSIWTGGTMNLLGIPTPARFSLIVRRLTGSPMRSRMGRFFMGTLDVMDFDGDVLHSSLVPSYQAAADTMVAPFVVDGVKFTPCVCSYRDSALYPITRFFVSGETGSVRRRNKRTVSSSYPIPHLKPPPP